MKHERKYADLHCHLTGAVTARIAKRLAEMQGLCLPARTDEELERMIRVAPDCACLNEFLELFRLPCSLMQTRESLKEGAYLVAEGLRESGTVYAEIRFAPQSHTRQGLTQEEAIRSVLAGLAKSELKTNLILCCMRWAEKEAVNLETVALAKKYLVHDGGVVALDMAGDEKQYPIEEFANVFSSAREYGIPFTIHAGEAAGPESVRKAVLFGAKRIGHGVSIYRDERVMELVRDKGVCLEMCPSSNRITKAFCDLSKYPLKEYLDYGIRVTVNTDDPAILGTDIAKEYRCMTELLGLSAEQERQIVENAIDAAFTTDAVKNELRAAVFGTEIA